MRSVQIERSHTIMNRFPEFRIFEIYKLWESIQDINCLIYEILCLTIQVSSPDRARLLLSMTDKIRIVQPHCQLPKVLPIVTIKS